MLQGMIEWSKAKEILDDLTARERSVLDNNADKVILFRSQGAIRILKLMRNLPELIKEADQHKEEK